LLIFTFTFVAAPTTPASVPIDTLNTSVTDAARLIYCIPQVTTISTSQALLVTAKLVAAVP